jgi:hypothetical protein
MALQAETSATTQAPMSVFLVFEGATTFSSYVLAEHQAVAMYRNYRKFTCSSQEEVLVDIASTIRQSDNPTIRRTDTLYCLEGIGFD